MDSRWRKLQPFLSAYQVGMSIETSKSEKFLQLNDIDNGVVIFPSYINLKCLCDVDDVFMDGTFKCCPKISNSFTLYMDIRKEITFR
jgi:hypothetical protein